MFKANRWLSKTQEDGQLYVDLPAIVKNKTQLKSKPISLFKTKTISKNSIILLEKLINYNDIHNTKFIFAV